MGILTLLRDKLYNLGFLMTLADLKDGQKGIIVKIRGRGAFRKRITEMGFVKGKEIEVIKNAPLRDPVEYRLMGYNISLRRSEAALIEIFTEEDAIIEKTSFPKRGNRLPGTGQRKNRWNKNSKAQPKEPRHKNRRFNEGELHKELIHITETELKETAEKKSKTINIAFVGNPNCGKTTLFNYVSGSRERVGNYGGVTVDAKKAFFQHSGYNFEIVDLPGTYSITEYTPEELFVREYIIDKKPDVIINVLDASNLERNLYLTTQLIDMDVKVVAALNMFDELEKRGGRFDYDALGAMIGIPFIPTVGIKGKGVDDLFDKAIEVYEDREKSLRHVHINYDNDIEKAINSIQKAIKKEDNYSLTDCVSSRFLSLKLLEKDTPVEQMIFERCNNRTEIIHQAKEEIDKLEEDLKEDCETLIIDAKYGFIAGALKETYFPAELPARTINEKIDKFLTHRFLGFPIFLFFMWLTFTLTFSIGEFGIYWIEKLVTIFSHFFQVILPQGILKELIIDGAIAGVGGVVVFLPNILLLFFMISLMEDTGYMARASFIMDKLMHKLGLHGKSFIPLLMGFGCNVPAIMATRTLKNKNDRLLTMLIVPFMSCSARLPIFVLLISAFFPEHPGTMLFLIYVIGVFVAIISALILKKFLFSSNDIPFVMELPPYRRPRLKNTLKHMWEKGVEYLRKIAGVVLIASILIWALGTFPRNIDYSENYDEQIKTAKIEFNENVKPEKEPLKLEKFKEDYNKKIAAIELSQNREALEKSYIGQIGIFVEPLIEPLGFDWRMGVSIITGLAAKEIVVSTMGVLYNAEKSADENSKRLINNLKHEIHKSGKHKDEKIFSPLVAFSFIIFILVYFPCIAVIAAIRRESGSWKWAIFSAVYTTSIAWILSFAIYQIGRLFL